MNELSKVIDPETGIDVLSMGLITKLDVKDDGKVYLVFRPSTPTCPLGFRLAFDIKNTLMGINSVKEIDMKVTDFVNADKLNQILSEINAKK